MRPSHLQAKEFKHYPPRARHLAVSHIALLRQLPIGFVPLLLQQIREYDWQFPAEQRDMGRQLIYLASLSQDQRSRILAGFYKLQLSSPLEHTDWVNAPGLFSERLSAYLWASRQIDAFRIAAEGYIQRLNAAAVHDPLPTPRLGIVVIGQGVAENKYPLFRKLRPHGVYFSRVNPENGLRTLLDASASRAAAHPVPYAHWYIDGGGEEQVAGPALTRISYNALAPVRTALLNKIDKAIHGGLPGPEALRTMLHEMRPEEIGLSSAPDQTVLSHFQTSLLTMGSGTQIFSTTFVQWAAREALRRAQPLTLLAHFAPRQRERPMNELLSGKNQNPVPDPVNSLIDADMGAYYTWLDQRRLPHAEQSSFLVWFENHHEALAVSPSLPRNTESTSAVDLAWLLGQIA